jgi:hypothetical protein
VVRDDATSNWTVKKTFPITDQQLEKLADSINPQLQKPEEYNMQTNNCATWVIDEAGIAGVSLPETMGSSDGGTGADPGDLGQDIRDQGGEVNLSLPTSGSSGTRSSGSSGSPGSGSSAPGFWQKATEEIKKRTSWN